MGDSVTFDHINTQEKYDLKLLCESDESVDDPSYSPYELSNNTCRYYEPDMMKDVFLGVQDAFSLFCMNCQGLRSHWDSFYNLLQEMGNDAHCFDVIGITEIFGMNKGQCSLPGYHPLEFVVLNDSNNSKGGVGLYIKNIYKYHIRTDLSILPSLLPAKRILGEGRLKIRNFVGAKR